MKLHSIHILFILILVLILCKFVGECKEGYNNIGDVQRDISNGIILPLSNNMPSDVQTAAAKDSSGNKVSTKDSSGNNPSVVSMLDQSGNLVSDKQHIVTPPEDYVKQTDSSDKKKKSVTQKVATNNSKKHLNWIKKVDREASKVAKKVNNFFKNNIPNYSNLLKLNPLQIHEVNYNEVKMPSFGELDLRPLKVSEIKGGSSISSVGTSMPSVVSSNATANTVPTTSTTSSSRSLPVYNNTYTPIPITADFSKFSK